MFNFDTCRTVIGIEFRISAWQKIIRSRFINDDLETRLQAVIQYLNGRQFAIQLVHSQVN